MKEAERRSREKGVEEGGDWEMGEEGEEVEEEKISVVGEEQAYTVQVSEK